MNIEQKLVNYASLIGLVDSHKVDDKFLIMFLQLNYLYKNIPNPRDINTAKTAVAIDLYTRIKNSSESYSQFLDLDTCRLAFYTLLNGCYKSELLSDSVSIYKFSPTYEDNYFKNLISFIETICKENKSPLFDVRTYVSLDEDENINELNCSEDVKEFIGAMVESLVNDIIRIHESLYASGYDGVVPDGVLWRVGELAVEPNVDAKNGTSARYKFVDHRNPSLLKLYQYINANTNNQFSLNNYDGHMKVKHSNIEKGCLYYPHFQVRNSCGLLGLDASLDKWLGKNKKLKVSSVKEFKDYIREEVTKAVMQSLGELQENLKLSSITDITTLTTNDKISKLFDNFKKAFTTCAIVSESKKDVVLKLKICIGSNNVGEVFSKSRLEIAIKNGLICNPYTKVSNWVLDESKQVLTVTFMMDEKRYNSFPYFALNILDSLKKGGKLDWSRVVIGRDEHDKMFTLNLKANTNRILAIIAGSRSGKGVLTLMLESMARALGITTFYLDYKPDMSKTYYDMAKMFGSEVFAFDGNSATAELGRNYDTLSDFSNIPKEVQEAMSELGFDTKGFSYFTSYIRGIHLLNKLIVLRAKAIKNGGTCENYTLDDLGGERIFIVLDEIEKLAVYADKTLGSNNSRLSGEFSTLSNKTKQILLEGGESNSTVDRHPSVLWYKAYRSWAERAFSDLEKYDKAEIGQSGTNIVILAQSVNIDESWGFIGQRLSRMIIDGLKFCGNGSATGKGAMKYGSASCSEWVNELPNRKFVIQRSAGGSVLPENSSLVKTYFLLNEVYNQDGSESTSVKELFGALGQDAEDIRKEVSLENGRLNPALGYLGYIKELTGFTDEQLGETFQKSYDVASLISKEEFKADSLLDYMYNLTDYTSGTSVVTENNEADNIRKTDSNEANIGLGDIGSSDSPLDFSQYSEKEPYSDESSDTSDLYKNQELESEKPETNENSENPYTEQKPNEEKVEEQKYSNNSADEQYSSEEQRNYNPNVYTNAQKKESAFENGKDGRVYADKSDIKKFTTLNNDNSIDCRSAINTRAFKEYHKLVRTQKGARLFREEACKRIFTLINNSVGIQNVTSISLVNECMIVNKKFIDLNGLVGGDTGRKLSDLVSFKQFIGRFRGLCYLEMNGAFLDNYILENDLEVSSKALLNHLFNSFNALSEVKLNQDVITRTKYMLENRKLDAKVKEDRQRNSADSMLDRMSKHTRGRNSAKAVFNSESRALSKHERPRIGSLISKAGSGVGLALFKIFNTIDWLANGR